MKRNKKHGFGKFLIPLTLVLGIEHHRYGFKFVGEWKDGKRCGKMTYHDPVRGPGNNISITNQFYVAGVLKYHKACKDKSEAFF